MKYIVSTKTSLIAISVIIFAALGAFGFGLYLNKDINNTDVRSSAASNPSADLNTDSQVNITDLSILISKWATNDAKADINDDGTVSIQDLSVLISSWGPVTTPPTAGAGCNFGSVAAPCIGGPTTGASGWGSPVFLDEFNSSTLDTNKWSPCFFPASFNGSDTCGEMNDSVTKKSNVRMENGAVVLRQSSTQENSATDAGALINTDPKQVGSGKGFQMGSGYYAEARVYFPGNGSMCYNWPAWWINGGASGFSDGEIDVAEIGGSGVMGSNYHFDRGNGREITQNKISGYWCGGYHTYGVDRQAGKNVIYFDGKQVASYTTYDKGAAQYLIFNVGYKTGKTPASGSASDVKIDYVRVWKK